MTNGTGRHRVARGRSGTLVEVYRCRDTRAAWWARATRRRVVLACTAVAGACAPIVYAVVTSLPGS